jgi:Skp family chaperone for outer membrane proteins
MKHIASLTALLIGMASAGLSWCQVTTTPTSAAPISQATIQAESNDVAAIRRRMKAEVKRINADLKNGNLSQEDASVLKEKVKMVGQQITVDLQQSKLNNQNNLTKEQVQEINRMLSENSMAMRNEKLNTSVATPEVAASSTSVTNQVKPVVVPLPVSTATVTATTLKDVSVPVTNTIPVTNNNLSGAPKPASAPHPDSAPLPGSSNAISQTKP